MLCTKKYASLMRKAKWPLKNSLIFNTIEPCTCRNLKGLHIIDQKDPFG